MRLSIVIRPKQPEYGAEEDRTPDPLLAKQVLSQTELRPLELPNINGGPEGSRTTDLVLIRDAL